jgi:ATP-dependent DNA helicase RecG
VVYLEGKALVAGHVPPNNGTLYQAGGVFPIRRGTHTVPLEAPEIERHLHHRGTLAWEARPVAGATEEDLDPGRVEEYLAHRPGRRGQRAAADPQTLTRIGCLAPDPADPHTLRPTHAGLLLFGHAPQELIMQAEVVCILFGDEVGLRRYLDRRIVQGTLPQQIDQVEAFLSQHMPVSARLEGFHRVDEPAYPLSALREALVNAVVHRDYSLTGEAVRLFYYPDRIEVHSPGPLLPGLHLDDLRAGHVPSRPRNPLLASLLRDVPGGYMERSGTGITFMIAQMRALGRPDPEFREQNEFVVTFRHAAPRAATDGPRDGTARLPTGRREPDTGPQRSLDLTTRQELALGYVQEHGAITNRAYRALTGVSDTTALRDLEALVRAGTLRGMGQGRSRRYTM